MPDLPRAFLFDLDDTLTDDSSNVDSGWRTAVADFVSPDTDVDHLVRLVHEVRDWYWSDAERHRVGRADLLGTSTWIVAEALSRLGAPDERLAGLIGNRYRYLREEGVQLLPGAMETLEALRTKGVRLALLTSGKPDERVYRGALAALEAEPRDTWMVGDNLEWDVAAPMRLGITGIWYDRHAAGLPTSATSKLFEDGTRQPDRIIRSLAELL